VPANDITWPKETWGMNLGIAVMSIRGGKSHVDKRADLESIGFNYTSQSLRHRYELVKVALLAYKDLNGDMLVPQIFVVPTDDMTWPKETWGMNLGTVVSSIRAGTSYVGQREDLESIGFDFNPQQSIYESIRAALLKYKDLKGNMLIPQRFVVPVNDITWPKETWGMKLGTKVDSIRGGKSWKDKREDLESIGFNFDPQKLLYGYEATRAALLKYKDLKGDMLVPKRFVVPANDITWPKETWGMKLGISVNKIRGENSWKDKRENLESIGFAFNAQSTGPKVAL
jgi:hypothetical protein